MWRTWMILLVACRGPTSSAPTSAPAAMPLVVPNTSMPEPRERIAVDISKALPTPAPKPEPVAAIPFSPDPIDDGTTKGAVAIPSDEIVDEQGVNFRDTTVTLGELPSITAKWQRRERVTHAGRVPFAIHHWTPPPGAGILALSFVGEPNETGYPGALETFGVTPSDDQPDGVSTFSALEWSEDGSVGPIHLAIRVLPTRDSAEATRRQVVVYTPPKSKLVLVATKLVTDSTWTPVLRVDAPNATKLVIVSPGWH